VASTRRDGLLSGVGKGGKGGRSYSASAPASFDVTDTLLGLHQRVIVWSKKLKPTKYS